MVNQVVLVGRIANDMDLKYVPSGAAVVSFRVAVDRDYKEAGKDKAETDFIDCVAWRQQAEFAANYLSKGRLVSIVGKLQVRSYEARDGGKRKVVEIVVDRLKGLDRPKNDNGGGGERTGGGGGPEEVPAYDDPFQDE